MNKVSKVAVIMGSQSDFPTMKHAVSVLEILNISYDVLIVSAHRTPDRLYDFAKSAKKNGFRLIIAGAGGAAHLPGMVASITDLPVIGVPIVSSPLNGLDSLLSIVQMPKGIPVATMALGEAGAYNAAMLAASIFAVENEQISNNLTKLRNDNTSAVREIPI